MHDSNVVIRRTPKGWVVGDEAVADLTTAMALADLLTADLRPGEPPRRVSGLDETGRLALCVAQLEHALAARVTVEQAIGVLSERQHTSPRDAFELMRKVARARGMKVHDLARTVVASVTDSSVPLPPELPSRR